MMDHDQEKLTIQELQYEFPYHYIPHFTEAGDGRRHRSLGWGFEYLCYQRHIKELVCDFNPVSVLEVGCGDGYFIGSLGDKVKKRAGADFSKKAIGFAKAFNPDVDFYACDARDVEGVFDVVAAIEVLEHIPDSEIPGFIQVLFDKVRAGGYVVISVPSVALPLNKKHFRHYSTGLLRQQVEDVRPEVEVVSEAYVCRIPGWMRFYNKITVNRYWFLDIGIVSGWVWRRLWNYHRYGNEKNGRHVVGVFKKPED